MIMKQRDVRIRSGWTRWTLSLAALLSAAAAAGAGADDRDRREAPEEVAEPARVQYDGHRLVRTRIADWAEVRAIERLGGRFWNCRVGPGMALVSVPAEAVEALGATTQVAEVLEDDVQSLIDAERARLDAAPVDGAQAAGQVDPFFDDYRDLATVNAYMDTLVALRPDLVSKMEIGQSHEGRPIFALRISSAPEGERAGILINGCQHAREWITVPTTMFVADRLIREYDTNPDVQRLVDELEWHIIPMVNPDGYEHTWIVDRLWRKNRRDNGGGVFGVDLNRNWSVGFGGEGSSSNPSSNVFSGPAPFSEPGVAAIRDYVVSRPHIRGHFDVHNFSQAVLGPWAHKEELAPLADVMKPLGNDIKAAMSSLFGSFYQFGTGNQILPLAGGAAQDWSFGAAFGEAGMVSFTLELRDRGEFGFLLPADQIIPTSEEVWAAAEVMAERLLRPLEFTFPEGLPEFLEPQTAGAFPVLIREIAGAPQSASLRWRVAGETDFASADLTLVQDDLWSASTPGIACGATLEYFLEATTADGETVTFPEEAPAELLTAQSATTLLRFADDFEVDQGWQVNPDGTDTATTGIWERVDPIATAAQPGEDNPTGTGTLAFITGQHASGQPLGFNDVDGGVTTLLSPLLSASGDEAFVTYARWWSNDQGVNPDSNALRIEISSDDGATWTLLEEVDQSEPAWTERTFRIADFVEPTDQVRLRFIAADLPELGGSIAEAGVDDVRVTTAGCSPTADLDGDGLVGPTDLALLLGAWGGAGVADLNGDGTVDASDLALLLGQWDAGA